MIKGFRHKGLKELFFSGKTSGVSPLLHQRILRRLDALDSAEYLGDLLLPGFDLHGLHGKPKRYSVHVSGAWCLTFEWHEPYALGLDLEQYH